MKTYDTIGYQWIQNLMFTNTPNYRSKICNTDIFGLRFNHNNHEFKSIFEQEIKKEKIAMVGSSTTFGVGASSDEKTIPSMLSINSNYHTLNLGVRAHNGFQEIILFQSLINKIKNLKKIILFSGMNDVYMSYNQHFISRYPGPMYFNKEFLDKMNETDLSLKRRILKFFFPNLNINYRNITKKEIINLIFKKNINDNFDYNYPKIDLEELVLRNLQIWSHISQSMHIKIIFFFPPFIYWCKKKQDYSSEENQIQQYINKNNNFNLQHNYEIIGNKYVEIKNLFKTICDKYEIDFYDCNEIFNDDIIRNKWTFVDKVHLNDYGNSLISKFILSKL